MIKLRTTENGTLLDLAAQTRSEVRGETDLEIELSSPKMVNLDGRIPVILVPVQKGSSEVKLNPPTYREAAGETAQAEISQVVSELLVAIQAIDKDIRQKAYDKANFKIDELQKKYPRVAFLNFTKASILFLEGKKSRARQLVMKALEAHPNFQEGKDFLKALGGPLKEGEGGQGE